VKTLANSSRATPSFRLPMLYLNLIMIIPNPPSLPYGTIIKGMGGIILFTQHRVGQPDDDLGPVGAEHNPDELENQEGDNPAVDVIQLDSFQAHSREVKEGVAEGRGQEGHLQVDGQHGREPKGVKPHGLGYGQKDWEGDHDDPDPVDEAAQNNVDDLHHPIGSHGSQT